MKSTWRSFLEITSMTDLETATPAVAKTESAPPVVFFGVGFDTARYGHHATFLDHHLDFACPPFEFVESQEGYQRLLKQFKTLTLRFDNVHFHIRIDAAGQYACNLETFLHALSFPKTISVGEPARNQNYRKAIFPKRKADPTESLCAARFALLERPKQSYAVPTPFYHLRELVQRLEGQTRQNTRLTNQLHNLLARVFPELSLIVDDLQTAWILKMLDRYPTPRLLARARTATLHAIPYIDVDKAEKIQTTAAQSVASFDGDAAVILVRQLVRQLRLALREQKQLKKLVVQHYERLPNDNLIDSIPGIGAATAAVLTAKMVAIERFAAPERVVGFFGVFPEEYASGLDKKGNAKPGRMQHMSRKGNDLARKYLWNAAKTAIVHNPAVRALYRRLRARGCRGDVALGHCMRKLLHLVFAVWSSKKPFDPMHYPWQPGEAKTEDANEKTAGHNEDAILAREVVSADGSKVTPNEADDKSSSATAPEVPASPTTAPTGGIDYAALRSQVSMIQVLEHLGCLEALHGSGLQRRGPCPIHAPDDRRNRSFSVHLGKKVFQCFHPPCSAHGNVLDLWAAIHGLPLYEAARHLATTFDLEL